VFLGNSWWWRTWHASC